MLIIHSTLLNVTRSFCCSETFIKHTHTLGMTLIKRGNFKQKSCNFHIREGQEECLIWENHSSSPPPPHPHPTFTLLIPSCQTYLSFRSFCFSSLSCPCSIFPHSTSVFGNDLIKAGLVACPLCVIATGVCLYFALQLPASFFCSRIS